jgi:hypothetical protein
MGHEEEFEPDDLDVVGRGGISDLHRGWGWSLVEAARLHAQLNPTEGYRRRPLCSSGLGERERGGALGGRERKRGRTEDTRRDGLPEREREREDLGQGTWAARLTSGAERNRSVQSQHAEASPARGEEQVCGGGRDGCGAVASTCESEERMRG